MHGAWNWRVDPRKDCWQSSGGEDQTARSGVQKLTAGVGTSRQRRTHPI